MIDDSTIDDAVDKSLEQEIHLANQEMVRLMRHWGDRDANPMIVAPVVVTGLLTALRENFDKETYDNVVRNILAAVESDVKQNEDEDDGYRRGVH